MVVCGLRELKKRRRLTHEIPSTDHDIFPTQLRSAKHGSANFVPAKLYKSELWPSAKRDHSQNQKGPFTHLGDGKGPAPGMPVLS
jgi:hypothetical protein